MPDRDIWLLERREDEPGTYTGLLCDSEEEFILNQEIDPTRNDHWRVAVIVSKHEFEEIESPTPLPLFRIEEPIGQVPWPRRVVRPVKLDETAPLDELLAMLLLKPTENLHDLYCQLHYATIEELLSLCETFDTT